MIELETANRPDTRAFARGDLDAMVALDTSITGFPRREYFERRLACALRQPAMHAQLVARDAHGPAGYLLARVMAGEFGRTEPALRLEVIGVRPDAQGHGTGAQLLGGLIDFARRHGIREVRTAAAWNDHRMVPWLDAMGFTLAANHIVDCPVAGGRYQPYRDDAQRAPEQNATPEINYGAPPGDDFERLARDSAQVGAMSPADLGDIVRIDRRITGRDREPYMRSKLDEAMDDAAIRVSLTARCYGTIVGFLMARADLGDFGRTAPVAVLDTIGVDPDYAHIGIGHALMSQLFANLGALRIDSVETVVAPHDLDLLGFLYQVGFAPSSRLPFVLALA
jgi:GNAT superfamily N-acetyltransferase